MGVLWECYFCGYGDLYLIYIYGYFNYFFKFFLNFVFYCCNILSKVLFSFY